MATPTLTLPNIAEQVNNLFERMRMMQELTRLAIENLPNSTDSDVPVALLTGMQAILADDTFKTFRLWEGLEQMTRQSVE